MHSEYAMLDLLTEWNMTVQAGCLRQVAGLYSETAILLPTLSSRIRRNRAEICEHFTNF